MNAAQFRIDFPEFADTSKYPDARVNFNIGMATKRLNVDRWADMLDYGIELYTAHHLVLSARAQAAADLGGLTGVGNGVIASKAVDKASVAFDTAAGTIDDGAAWNLTTYGVEFLQLSRLAGAAGVQI